MTQKEKRLRLNADMRQNALNVILRHYEGKDTKKKSNMKKAKEVFDEVLPVAHAKIKSIIRKYQPQSDVDTINRMRIKYNDNGGRITDDACFHMFREVDGVDYEGNKVVNKESKHFDFKLYGNTEGYSDNEFAYAYYRDELKAHHLNPDINVQMNSKNCGTNPHWTKTKDAIDDYLGYNRSSQNSNDTKNYSNQWKDKYQFQVIGTSYCSSRQFKVSEADWNELQSYQIARSNVVKTHYAYAEWLQKKKEQLEAGLKTYKYFDEIQKLCDNPEVQCPINESQIHGESSVALSVYSPDNLASLLNDDDEEDDIKATLIANFKANKQLN